MFAARVIPYRGSWLDFEFDAKDILYVRIDRRRKLPASTLLLALVSGHCEAYLEECEVAGEEVERNKVYGMPSEEILDYFYDKVVYEREKNGWKTTFNAESFRGRKLNVDLVDAKKRKPVANAGDKLTQRKIKQLVEAGLKEILVEDEELIGQYSAKDLFDPDTGEVFFPGRRRNYVGSPRSVIREQSQRDFGFSN